MNKDIKKVFTPQMYFLVALVLMIALDRILPGIGILDTKIGKALGFLFLGFGAAMVFWVMKINMLSGMSLKTNSAPTKVLTAGPYSYCRNPMYLGMVISLFGLFCFMGSSVPLIIVFVFGGLVEDKFIIPEEKYMEEKFGDEYLKYKAKVSRWFPLLTDFAWEQTHKQKKKNANKK